MSFLGSLLKVFTGSKSKKHKKPGGGKKLQPYSRKDGKYK